VGWENRSVNRRLSLRWFEPNTCHQVKPQFTGGFRYCGRGAYGAVCPTAGGRCRSDPGLGLCGPRPALTCRNEMQWASVITCRHGSFGIQGGVCGTVTEQGSRQRSCLDAGHGLSVRARGRRVLPVRMGGREAARRTYSHADVSVIGHWSLRQIRRNPMPTRGTPVSVVPDSLLSLMRISKCRARRR
jgi:hypothetical protein